MRFRAKDKPDHRTVVPPVPCGCPQSVQYTARLISSGYEIAPKSTYLIDRESNVYIYLDELGAAVESEYAYACDENGEQIAFSVTEAKRLPVLSMEAALEQLSMI